MMFPTFTRWLTSIGESLAGGFSIIGSDQFRKAAGSTQGFPDRTTKSLLVIATVLYVWQLIVYLWMESASHGIYASGAGADASMGSVFTYFLFGLAPCALFSLPLMPLAWAGLWIATQLTYDYSLGETLNQLVFLAVMLLAALLYGRAALLIRTYQQMRSLHASSIEHDHV